MNGLQITGTKFTTPNPIKKAVVDPKSIKITSVQQTPVKKPILAKNNTKTIKK